ncbi:hypothetical protein F5B21DRAFT_481642 [Xylaria acuta]|nr:hypothetical protein F5B21DRAFT_481642 [Xylaria acuta]
MSFQPQRLDPGITFDDAQPTPEWIVGRGQRIYWRRCFVRIYTTTNKLYAHKHTDTCDGQAIVPQGTELFVGGEGGQVKEEQVASAVSSSSVAGPSAVGPSSDAAFSSSLAPPRPKRPRLDQP